MKKFPPNKRKNLKLKYKAIIIISSLIIIIYTHTRPQYQPSISITKKELINNILAYSLDEKIDENFLQWINQEYSKNVLEELNNYLKETEYNSKIWHQLTNNSFNVLQDQYNEVTSERMQVLVPKSTIKETTINFIGDVSLADNWYIMPKYDERNQKIYGILSKEVVNILTSSDITIANNEFTISNRGEKIPNKYYTFRASPERLNIYKEMGVNLVTLANNHIYDFGIDAFYDSLEALKQYQIPYIGAGYNIEEAKQPYYYIINGYKIAFVNATRAEKIILTKEATDTTGGVLRCYDPTTFIQVIEETKKTSDFVIALVHWGKEDSTILEQVQLDTSKQYIDAGADLIVGTHAHILQGIDFYNNKAIIYNLGDFIFNNETKDTGIFQLKIDHEGNFTYHFKPCKESNEYTSILTDNEKQIVLNKLQNLSPNIIIEEDGQFYQKITQ